MSKVKLYAESVLPLGFRYPEAMHALVGEPKDFLYPWFFFDPDLDVGRLRLELARERKLIPFASLELGDGDTACFDASDTSGDPSIIMMITDGSDRGYAFPNFEAWMAQAHADAERWSK